MQEQGDNPLKGIFDGVVVSRECIPKKAYQSEREDHSQQGLLGKQKGGSLRPGMPVDQQKLAEIGECEEENDGNASAKLVAVACRTQCTNVEYQCQHADRAQSLEYRSVQAPEP